MAKVKVTYLCKVTETIDWPDDEMDDFNYENLEINLNPDEFSNIEYHGDILSVKVDGKEHEF